MILFVNRWSNAIALQWKWNYIVSLQDQHLPPPPPPPKKTEEQQRMSLADRLRTEFGLDEPSAESSLPPPPPPPPPPVDALDAQWGNGPSTQPSVAYQTRSSRRW
jgi:hypothetical protein